MKIILLADIRAFLAAFYTHLCIFPTLPEHSLQHLALQFSLQLRFVLRIFTCCSSISYKYYYLPFLPLRTSIIKRCFIRLRHEENLHSYVIFFWELPNRVFKIIIKNPTFFKHILHFSYVPSVGVSVCASSPLNKGWKTV